MQLRRTNPTVDDIYFGKLLASLDEPAKPIPSVQKAVRKNATSPLNASSKIVAYPSGLLLASTSARTKKVAKQFRSS